MPWTPSDREEQEDSSDIETAPEPGKKRGSFLKSLGSLVNVLKFRSRSAKRSSAKPSEAVEASSSCTWPRRDDKTIDEDWSDSDDKQSKTEVIRWEKIEEENSGTPWKQYFKEDPADNLQKEIELEVTEPHFVSFATTKIEELRDSSPQPHACSHIQTPAIRIPEPKTSHHQDGESLRLEMKRTWRSHSIHDRIDSRLRRQLLESAHRLPQEHLFPELLEMIALTRFQEEQMIRNNKEIRRFRLSWKNDILPRLVWSSHGSTCPCCRQILSSSAPLPPVIRLATDKPKQALVPVSQKSHHTVKSSLQAKLYVSTETQTDPYEISVKSTTGCKTEKQVSGLNTQEDQLNNTDAEYVPKQAHDTELITVNNDSRGMNVSAFNNEDRTNNIQECDDKLTEETHFFDESISKHGVNEVDDTDEEEMMGDGHVSLQYKASQIADDLPIHIELKDHDVFPVQLSRSNSQKLAMQDHEESPAETLNAQSPDTNLEETLIPVVDEFSKEEQVLVITEPVYSDCTPIATYIPLEKTAAKSECETDIPLVNYVLSEKTIAKIEYEINKIALKSIPVPLEDNTFPHAHVSSEKTETEKEHITNETYLKSIPETLHPDDNISTPIRVPSEKKALKYEFENKVTTVQDKTGLTPNDNSSTSKAEPPTSPESSKTIEPAMIPPFMSSCTSWVTDHLAIPSSESDFDRQTGLQMLKPIKMKAKPAKKSPSPEPKLSPKKKKKLQDILDCRKIDK